LFVEGGYVDGRESTESLILRRHPLRFQVPPQVDCDIGFGPAFSF
jgi:hypothetical protein